MPPMFLQNHRHLFLSLAVLCTRPVLLPLRSYEGELRTRSKKSNLRRTPNPTRTSRRYDATIVLNTPRPVALIRARLGARSPPHPAASWSSLCMVEWTYRLSLSLSSVATLPGRRRNWHVADSRFAFFLPHLAAAASSQDL